MGRLIIHHITNYVSVNECANITLAVGASPVMADDIAEVADITSISNALVLNIGTLNARTVESMLAAGVVANKKNIPVILDPVGVGASKFRNETVAQILEKVKLTVLRGNLSEIRFVAGFCSNTQGVDAGDVATAEETAELAKNLAKKLGCIVVVSGATDVISDGERVALVTEGHPSMQQTTGTGCMCTSVIASLVAKNPDDVFGAATRAMQIMGAAGMRAHKSGRRIIDEIVFCL